MHTGVYLVKNKGREIPQSLWELVLKNNTSGFGVASSAMDDFAVKEKTKPSLEEVLTCQQNLKDVAVIFSLFESVGEFKDEDVQPFVVLDEPGGKVAAFLDGEFKNFDETEGHTREFEAAEYLSDKLETLWAKSKGDMDKFMDLLRAPMFTKELAGVIGDGNSITLLSSNGEIMSFGKATAFQKNPFEWGWATNYYGDVPFKEETKPKEEAPKGMAALFAKRIETAKAGEPKTLQTVPAVTQTKDKGPTLADVNATAGLGTDKGPDSKIWIQPRETDMSQNKLQKWYHRFDGNMPREKWMKKPAIQVSRLLLATFQNWKEVPAPSGLEVLAQVDKTKLTQKDIAPAHIPQDTPATPVHGPSDPSKVEIIPRVPSEDQKKLVAFLQNAKLLTDPATFKDMEAKYPTILDISGGKLKRYSDLYRMGFTQIHEMVGGNHTAAVAIMGLAGYVFRLEERIGQLSKTASEEVPQKVAV